MICDNCGAIIDKGEEYCANCGMQLIDLPVKQKKSKNIKYSNNDNYIGNKKSDSLKKPIKEKYIEYSDPESPDYSYYDQENEYEPKYEKNNFKEETPKVQHKKSSGTGLINIFLFLFIALLLGLIVGLLIFGSQSAQILGYKI